MVWRWGGLMALLSSKISGYLAGRWTFSSERRKLTFIVHLLCLRFDVKHLHKPLLEANSILIDEETEAEKRPNIIYICPNFKAFLTFIFSSSSLEQEESQGWEEWASGC